MAEIRKGILGGVSGKVGNVIGGSWKGIDYVRSLPTGGNSTNTQAQIIQRFKFSLLMHFLQSFTEFLRIGFKGLAVRQTAFNAAMSYNYHNAITGEYPDITIDYTKVAVSRGSLAAAVNPGCTSVEEGKVTLEWAENVGQNNASDSDVAMFVVYNPELEQSICVYDGGIRADGTSVIDLPVNYVGCDVHCYVSFVKLQDAMSGNVKDFISNSVYAGSVTVM